MSPQHSPLWRTKRLLQNHDTLGQWVQHILNAVIVSATLVALALWRDGQVGEHYRVMLVFSLLLMTIIYNLMGVFRRFDSLTGGMQHLARAWGTVIILLGWLAFLTKTSDNYSRQVIVYWALLAYILQAGFFYIGHFLHQSYRRHFYRRLPALMIGEGELAQHLTRSINDNIWINDRIVDHASLADTPESERPAVLRQLAERISGQGIRRIYVALPLEQTAWLLAIQNSLSELNIDIVWAPDIFSLHLLNHSVRELGGVPLINLNETPLRAGGPAFVKATMDKLIASLALVALSPLLLAAAAAVRFSSPGPIIFKQVRDGWDGKKFFVYKFRSMYVHEAKTVVEQAKRHDSRITPVGAFLRRTSIDELPQLFNVLNGSMSLVGPRPHAESHNQYYSTKVKAYLARHRIKPGITGLAQINGFRGETENLEDMEKRVEYDLAYISAWSPWLDLRILLATPMRLISKAGNAY
jgi:putative colanic acid biosysnthesis UDP-glucose lipid carrier transferase